jgi:hypothetical protein
LLGKNENFRQLGGCYTLPPGRGSPAYFERTNFQTNTPRVRKKRIVYIKCFFVFFLKNVVDTLSLAGHHNKREFSIDFYYNSIRISTDFKRNGNQETLKMEVR